MSDIIRILHVLGALNRGGAESMVMNLYRNMDRSKIQFDFVIHTDEDCDFNNEIRDLGGKIFSVPRYNGKNHFIYKKAWNDFFSKHSEYRIVHGHMRSTASIYLKIAKKYGLMTVSHSHSTSSRGNFIEKKVKDIMQYPIRNIADYLFSCSDDSGKWLFGENVIKRNNYKVIKNAIETDKYIFDENKRNFFRNSLDLKDKFVIGHVGSFTEPKNHDFLIDVFFEVLKKKSNSVLLLLGDGKLKNNILKKAENLNILNKIFFIGVVSNVYDYMQAMDVFVFPSLWEGLPVTVVEAQASGLPCIVSDNVTKEVFITPNIISESLMKGSEYWADKILSFWNHERKNMKKYVENSGFDIKDSVKELYDFYKNLYFEV
ncbi:glycosyltransferase [Oceanotoga sp. DSM 15011]|uniref:glycosyltransferase n=1 Tax=Oceanotoga sp. DSM 15011 TaxID=2984951 RepID=UPI0021F4CBED|nr:glycosyltransferase [Oceanotoga sp. DSM 15011]UYO99175.1 glycosyltransferase [Oceanotoga sp. DSM 15011]